MTIVVKQGCWNLQKHGWNLSLFEALLALNSQSNNISLRHRSSRVSTKLTKGMEQVLLTYGMANVKSRMITYNSQQKII